MGLKIDVNRFEFAILAETAKLTRVPMVATYSHYGARPADQRVAFREAEDECRRRGLIERGGQVSDDVWDLIATYSNTAVEYDLRFSATQGHELRACVDRAGQLAVRTVVADDRIVIDEVRAGDEVRSLMALLPESAPMRTPPMSVDLVELRAAATEAARDGEPDQRSIHRILRAKGVDVDGYRAMTQILDADKSGAGQLGVTVWDRHGKEHRGEETVNVFDVAHGRVALYNAGNQRVLAGADTATLDRVLGEIAARTHRNAQW
ncbi:hypothetical protein GIY23_02545 [Allosaccharopolyspora coralli]|uniref:ESX secretion-associated protein EspG n=1 Tax=Allosaccharopolyspora coralli TaxID=2665642 RepID=A0A5Q3Q430_9PSEU|nr:ESX secretion-associated protein EspG [Allosaccharopolyspora coralli]QGK68580.1 hypothetical protein GIY23_02545 [Allosaccharopolyspora coralli]